MTLRIIDIPPVDVPRAKAAHDQEVAQAHAQQRIVLDRTVLDGYARCQEHQCRVQGYEYSYRQCVKDAGHLWICEFGVWMPMPSGEESVRVEAEAQP